MIKADLILKLEDGQTIRVHKRSDVIHGAWDCTDTLTGELLVIPESTLLKSIKEQNN